MLGIPNMGKKIVPNACDFSSANILVIRPDVLGDILLTIPFLVVLKRQCPGARITLAVTRPWVKFIERLQIVDEVIEFPLNSDQWRAISNVFRAIAFGSKILKKVKFDIVLCPRWDADLYDAHLVALFSHAPQRIAFFENATPWKTASNRGRDAFYTHVVTDQGTRHESARSLYFLEAIGLPALPLEDKISSISIRDKVPLVEIKIDPSWNGCPLVGIFPGVQDADRQWPVENFIAAAKNIATNHPVRFLVLGTKKEAVQCERFCHEFPGLALNLSDKTDLMGLAGTVRQCSVVISCNSGGAHLAGVLEVPVAAIFQHPHGGDPENPSSPERFRPLGKNVRVLQPGMDNSTPVTADQVTEAALDLMGLKSSHE